ncbi:unnamed protein product [Trypanosoma congolense IL3000]|uniref:WGS project CAEQ00000000 data, annotated contig 866 n=1 Tax=Trypanosoma congolense (strain IL3000) TaxID=1068625 RepID=F9WJ35_TRYCI|nr:unnamed protein product [Trypanosoma congolense IL3000]
MVPMAAVLYGTLASACGHPRRRKGDDLDEDKSLGIAREVLPIGKKKFLDLKQFDCVLCINPTGWTGKPSKQKISDRVVSFKVPYSEHCSFSELIDFVSFVNPRVVIPTVSLKAFQQHESLFVEKAPQLRSRYSNVQPLMPFLTKVPKLSESRMSVMAGAADATAKTEKQRNPFARTKDTTLTLTHSLNPSERERKGEVPGPRGLSQSGWSGSTRIHQETRDHHTAKENIRKINGMRSVNRTTLRSSPQCFSKPNSVEQPIRPDDVVTEKLSAAGTTTESSSWSPGNEDDDCFVVKINGPVIDISDSSE